MNKVYPLDSTTYLLKWLSVIVNLMVYFSFMFRLDFQDLDALFIITLFIFIPMGLLILGFRFRNHLFMYGAFIISIPFGMYLFFLTPNVFIRTGGLLQVIYLIIAIRMTTNLSKTKKETK
ncbi:hypothetical protein ACFVR2_17635 [Gottfriedia sp. NPDC057991]|uniref:hypothetical protein n=1 Tax=Gottfriedia sp. NPDC057991 TaxID=3346298 RepID=UPI0036DBA9C1